MLDKRRVGYHNRHYVFDGKWRDQATGQVKDILADYGMRARL